MLRLPSSSSALLAANRRRTLLLLRKTTAATPTPLWIKPPLIPISSYHISQIPYSSSSSSYSTSSSTIRHFSSSSLPTPEDENKKNREKSPLPIVTKPGDLNNNTPKKKKSAGEMIQSGLISAYNSTKEMISNPKATWQWIKDGAHHYWVGTKLLWSEIKITGRILRRVLKGHEMTRRERNQLVRTTTDLFRLIPFAIFVIVPFMELLLPLALKLWPNMLPSTFEDSLQKEENLKKELQMRLAVAKFLQETLQEIANKKTASPGVAGAHELLEFVEQAQKGEHIPNEKVITMAKLFKDELTLPNMARPQLLAMCRYMGLNLLGSDDFLRFELRAKFRAIKEDDRRILWEGIDSLNTLELKDACRERGMRSVGISQFRLKSQLQEWLELSTQKNIPISLLIMSRAFSLTTSDEPEEVLKSSMSSLDSDTINEVVVASANLGEEKDIDIQKRKLESLKFQEELIEDEIESKESKKPENKKVGADEQTKELPAPENAKAENKELSLQEIQALSDLARGSSLFREKSELMALQTIIEELLRKGNHPEKIISQNAITHYTAEELNELDPKATKSLGRLKSVLQSMITKLHTKIESTEKVVGDKFNVLDKDGDGELSAEELKDAIVKLLRRDYTVEQAEAIINDLDNNKDGKISLSELLNYIHERRERLEASLPVEKEVASPATPNSASNANPTTNPNTTNATTAKL